MIGLHRSRLCAHTVFALLFAATFAGCATTSAEGDEFGAEARDRDSEDVRITIENMDFRDATVFAHWNGVRRRVGFVVGKTTRTFRSRWLSER